MVPLLCAACGHAVDPSAATVLVECHFCTRWLHAACVSPVTEHDALLGAKWACPDCQQHGGIYGVSTVYSQTNGHGRRVNTRSYSPPSVYPSHAITASRQHHPHPHQKSSAHFRRLLSAIADARSEVHVVPSHALHPSFLQQRALDEPVLFAGHSHRVAGLDASLPVLDAAVIAELLATNRVLVQSTDVATQAKVQLTALTWQLKACPHYLQEHGRKADKSVANAEFQVLDTPVQLRVAPPMAVARVDWRSLLPSSRANGPQASASASANVLGAFLECNSYLDFTLTPGGQCVWLSVSAGELWVYFIPPSDTNWKIYQAWKNDRDFATIFLAERVDTCIKCAVSAGSTLLIPAGWMFARFAGGVQSCSLFYGLFTCTSAMAAQLGVVLLEMQHQTLVQYRGYTTSGWGMADVNAELWAALRFYWNQLLMMHNGMDVHVSEQDRQALQRAIHRLREWSAHPASLKSVNQNAWVPSSQHEAQAVVDRVEQALAAIEMLTQRPEDLQPTTNLGCDSKLPPISVNEASYIYSAASVPDSDSGSVWGTSSAGFESSITSNFGSPVSTGATWASLDSLQQQQKQVRSTHNQPCVSNGPRFCDRAHHDDLPHNGSANYGYISPRTGSDGSNGNFMATLRSKHDLRIGLESLRSVREAPTYPIDAASSPMIAAVGPAFQQLQSNSAGGNHLEKLKHHRASCHRCGNLRKKNVWCSICPHIFCARCADKMHEEHGDRVFENGCPVCKELCCCGKNRTMDCLRMFHCYKKCPSTKRRAGG
ncbi:unnamed protein product [Hyaloperonospora brassicae]|uniref:JmjC domain-containing protein n=1 Tax=Hyaloperonospora brassicae TaxID=162125 RepID=A0AAV0T8R5_HYABA|nr:unnamed protein product [Hyaloperonospora brassicae]